MKIECGTTSQRRTRIIVATVVCAGMGGWFAYDGWLKYPAQNQAKIDAGYKTVPHSDSSIMLQRILAVAVGCLTGVAALNLLRVTRQRFVLDDDGLTTGSRQIPWDHIRQLKADRYSDRGWVDLLLTDGRKFRLDSYKIDLFDEMLQQICTRKNFTSPLPPPEPQPPKT